LVNKLFQKFKSKIKSGLKTPHQIRERQTDRESEARERGKRERREREGEGDIKRGERGIGQEK
jgi:hypothetical protein